MCTFPTELNFPPQTKYCFASTFLSSLENDGSPNCKYTSPSTFAAVSTYSPLPLYPPANIALHYPDIYFIFTLRCTLPLSFDLLAYPAPIIAPTG